MILKHVKKPKVLLSYEALLRRTQNNYEENQQISDDYSKFKAGFIGEKSLNYYLQLLTLDDGFIIHDLRLKIKDINFQIDVLIVTPKFICIIEVKYLKGILHYDSVQKQLIQQVDDKFKRFPDPLTQADIQKSNLEIFLDYHSLPKLPIEIIVVSTHKEAVIKNTHPENKFPENFIHSERLKFHFDTLITNHKEILVPNGRILSLGQKLLKSDRPLTHNLLNKYGLTSNNIHFELTCKNCQSNKIIRTNRNWLCTSCNTKLHKHAHERLIYDYFLIYNIPITNKICRNILGLNSRKTATIILKKMNLIHII